MKLGEVSPEMMEIGLWALAGHVGPGEMKHVDQEAMLRSVYHAMRTTEADLGTTPPASVSKASSPKQADLGTTPERYVHDTHTLVERMARAAAAHDSGPEGSELFAIHWQEFGAGYIETAQLMLEAASEPTEAMLFAADWLENGTRDAWKAMIDAALSEVPS